MHVFVTGGSGFVGSPVVRRLMEAGHEVTALARSDASAAKLEAAGAAVRRGELTDRELLADAAKEADGVIHMGFIHDFSQFMRSVEVDRLAIETFGEALAGTGKPLLVTSGLALKRSGALGTEEDENDRTFPRLSETAALPFVEKGVRACPIRLAASVHGDGDHGFVPALIGIAREKGFAAYVGDGENRWPGVHVEDAASLYVLALEKGIAGTRYHAVGDQGVRLRDIAAIIGRKLDLPVKSLAPDTVADHFGWMAHFVTMDIAASSDLTQQRLGWRPTGIGLIEDLETGTYFDA